MPLLDLAALYPDAGSLAPTLFTAATRLAEASAHNRPGAAAQASSSVASATDPTVLRDLSSLAALPDAAFFGVVGVHKGLPKVFTTVLDDVAGHRSVRLDAKSYEALVTVLVKITTSIRGDAERWPHPEKVASRLAMLLPAPCLPQLALCLQRKNAAISSIAVTSLLIQAPSILNHMKSVGSSWCDSVQALVANCVDDARRGRYQRKASDILSMAERAHRLSKQLWSLLQACPFIADFLCPLPKLIAALRSIVDTAAPMIQYFVMNSDELASRRQPLLRALASVVNAAVDTALYSLLFVSSHSASARIDFRLVTGPIDEKLSDALAKYGPFVVQAVLKAQPSIPKLLHQLAGGSSAQSGSPDALLASALGELDTERTNVPSVHIFAERVLTALAGLGVNIAMEDLGSNVQAAVKARRAEQQQHQGSAADVAALAAPMKGISASQPPPPASTTHDDPASQMVLDVLPHLNPAHVPAALAYYDGSVEALLDAAMSENLPPHLHDALHSTSLTVSPAVPAAPAAPTARDADDDAEPRPVVPPEAATVVERQGSVYGMLTENFGWDAARPDVDASGSFDGAAPSLDHRDTSEFFTLDEGLKATIAAMANDVYDDERDDGDDDMAPGRRGRAASFEFDSGSDDEDLAAPRRRQTLDAVLGPQQAQHGQTSAAPSAGHAAGGSRGGRGGYTAKPKTVVRGAPGQAHSNQTTSTGGAAPASGQQQHDAGRGRGGRPDHRRGGNSRGGGGGRGRDEGAKHRHRVQGGHEDD